MKTKTIKLFLASSTELKADRLAFEVFINRKNKEWVARGVFLELVIWEDFLDTMSQTGLQAQYNQAISRCDLFVMLCWTKVGRYTQEEFETAFGQFQAANRPFILTYFKDAPISTGSANRQDLQSLWAFQEKLDALGHFYTGYQTSDGLHLHFNGQLDKLAANGFINFEPEPERGTAADDDSYQATQSGSGSVAQGPGATALGKGAVNIGSARTGTINTGTQIIANYFFATDGTEIKYLEAQLAEKQRALDQLSEAPSGESKQSAQLTDEITQLTEHITQQKVPLARQVTGYLRWLRERTECIELRGIERAGGALVVRLELETAYVPLRAKWMNDGQSDLALSQVLGFGNRLVIVGGPGSGKTTVLMHMAWALASSLLAGEAEPARSRLGLTIAPQALPLPLFVPLASFARYLRNLPGNAPPADRTLAHFISYHLISKQANFGLPADFFVQVLKDGRDCLLLLDGLDEVANESERAEVRQSVDELVSGRDAMRVLVTCRTAAYRDRSTAPGARFKEILVQPLEFDLHIAPMIHQAYDCIYPLDAALRGERVTDLLDGIRRLEDDRRTRLGKDAEALVDSPLLVRLLLIVHLNNRRLPDERADLFDKAINALLQVDYGREQENITELTTDWKRFREMAQHLAFHMHGQGRDQGREIEEAALKAALGQEADFIQRIDDFLQSARQRGSVLEERTGVYRFIHLAFQEFLAARYLLEVPGRMRGHPAIVSSLEAHLNDPWWREPILLLAGYLGAHSATTSAREFLTALARAGETPGARIAAAELAGIASLEWRESGEALKAECAARIIAALGDASTPNECRASVRVRIADLVPRLGGDPRFDPGRYHLPGDDWLGFVSIDADPQFRIGTRPSDRPRVAKIIGYDVPDHEINDAPTPTPAFYIARYLVTVGQFRAFLAATRTEPRDPKALDDPESRPVRYIDWWETMAYCRWLHRALADGSVLAGSEAARLVRKGSLQVSLPGEREWEVAARGGRRGSVCPWGDMPNPDAANYGDSNIRDTTSVGCFLANGFGLYDMVGNVWEWTRSLWALDYSQVNDPRHEDLDAGDSQARVVRGGSWLNVQGLARCACRAMLLPDGRSNLVGFRVVLRSAPASSTPISVPLDSEL